MFIFSYVGEYDEARRVNEHDSHWIDFFQGRYDEAIRVAQRDLQLSPDNEGAIAKAALFLYAAGRLDEALPLYERLLDLVPEGQPISRQWGLIETIRLALARRQAGDEEGAQAVVQLARQDHAARRAAGRKESLQDLAEAMIAAFEHDPDRVIAALKSSMRRGLRIPNIFDEPIFEDLRDEPRFTALQREMDALLAEEHDKVLQLICFNNPVPDDWQPLPETCEGVVEQSSL
jgi:tetratricopeptide (TPR) repeat protein